MSLNAGWQVRKLPQVVGNLTLERLLDEGGFDSAYAALLQQRPELMTDLYRSIEGTIHQLRKAAADEIADLRDGNLPKIAKLRELYRAVKGLATLAGISLDS